MKTRDEKTSDAIIRRNSVSGRVVSVTTSKGVSRASDATGEVVAKVSKKHSEALKRLVNR